MISAPCASFLSVLPSCVDLISDQNNNNDVTENHDDDSDDDVYGYGDRVLLPHDLYENIDYSNRPIRSQHIDQSEARKVNRHSLYASVVPRSKRPIRGQSVDPSEASCDAKGGVIPSDTDRGVGDSGLAPENRVDLLKPHQPIRSQYLTSRPIRREENTVLDYSSNISIQKRNEAGILLSKVRDDNEDSNDRSQTPVADFLADNSYEASLLSGLLSSIPEATNTNENLQNSNHEIDSAQIRQKIRREFARLQRVRKSNILHDDGKKIEKNATEKKFLLPPVCGKSPPCDCPEDRLYASKLRRRILTKISTLRRKHLRLRVIFNNFYKAP